MERRAAGSPYFDVSQAVILSPSASLRINSVEGSLTILAAGVVQLSYFQFSYNILYQFISDLEIQACYSGVSIWYNLNVSYNLMIQSNVILRH